MDNLALTLHRWTRAKASFKFKFLLTYVMWNDSEALLNKKLSSRVTSRHNLCKWERSFLFQIFVLLQLRSQRVRDEFVRSFKSVSMMDRSVQKNDPMSFLAFLILAFFLIENQGVRKLALWRKLFVDNKVLLNHFTSYARIWIWNRLSRTRSSLQCLAKIVQALLCEKLLNF